MAFTSNKYPKNLKINRIKPTRKKGKEKLKIEGWRPVNIVTSLSKPIDRIMMTQILNYMINNNLIDPNNHGNMKNQST